MAGLLIALAALAAPPEQDAAPAPATDAQAQDGVIPTVEWLRSETDPKRVVTTIEVLIMLTILSLAPAIVVMMTAFTRIVIVLSFVRRALATQELPPNQVVVGLSLILTFMVMMPWLQQIKREALDPYTSEVREEQITQTQALTVTMNIMRDFMMRYTRPRDVRLFMDISGEAARVAGDWHADPTLIPSSVLIPAFVISELRQAFIMGFVLFLPFLVIDMVVAATLISMGMLVLPPIMISLPFKILLFILVDGWHLVIGSLVESFELTA